MEPITAPPAGTLERWAFDWIQSEDASTKLGPAAPPSASDEASWEPDAPARRLARPGRPPAWTLVQRAARSPGRGALKRPEARARLVHTFLHHELQAAELFAWALLAFPDAPREFRRGLVRLCAEELGHLAAYARHLATLGARPGDFPVRDWFWQRGAEARTPVEFLAFVGLGLEGGNLEHCARFADWFRDAGDDEGAALLERIERDEIGHLAFAVRWFERFSGGLDYERWAAALPEPLTPAVFRGVPLNRAARRKAGLDDAFLDRLAAEPPTTRRPT